MNNSAAQFSLLKQRCDGRTSEAIERLLCKASDFCVNRINPLAFAVEAGLDETACIGAFLHATQIGIVDLAWNVVCGGCGGILHSANSLKALNDLHYRCGLCAADCQTMLDDSVEVTFTVSPKLRPISAHEPDTLPLWDYVRQVYWSSGSDLPADLRPVVNGVALDAIELPAGSFATRTLRMTEGFVVVFDPVTHSSTLLRVVGTLQEVPQTLTIALAEGVEERPQIEVAPGPLELTLENRTAQRAMPILWLVGDALRTLVSRRVPSLSAKRLLSHQTFRDLYQTDVLDINQHFRITSLTFLFTDLKGSTALYKRIGDLAAFDLIRAHFHVLTDIIARNSGATVKTIGDAVMASFPTPSDGMAAALLMKKAMTELNAQRGSEDILLKIGLHAGSCVAVTLNERQDYFGQTVNIASRVQGLADIEKIVATEAVLADAGVRSLFKGQEVGIVHSWRWLRGFDEEISVYEIE
ncbi:DUF5939 domain-containing protein [Rhizobium sp. PRIMUS64]|uniref:adenylate/guanylate cyclase domain-containing protein n=1 Tax=Rhizobium TaxID=379 RepID=UPI000DE34FD0|nr:MULTISPECIES: adenylate/guanylate cyclase domain-containing protein [Rhizobium]MBY5905069.1 adenylate/guanylate cyclase domain-containing protein [Rhizobium leguminosarum]MBY5912160.1 adenylate/guanylate cyclase domain-containing protein [Rhizobium leguminosarum]MBY5919421.1 adenylate/guanylate cyclase domain-containing protein [Rhizobium leguminosarum]MCJ9690455.1 DUF5939 domain-containing protein [Rhizobium sp. PRIMUS64]TBY39986.1 adenylate/guanylate cyclase domain-containing protein [Rhi